MGLKRKYYNYNGITIYDCNAFTIKYMKQPSSWRNLSPEEVLLNITMRNIKVQTSDFQMTAGQYRTSENEIRPDSWGPIGDPLFDDIPFKRVTYGELKRIYIEVVINGRLPEVVYQECINRRLGLIK